ncbi:MAG: acetate kinase [Bacilli bacterium]|nr:acetate kinase [Bacilli bacterium]
MKILAVNCGSSSLKFKMYEMPEEKVLISGLFERIGEKASEYTIKLNGEKYSKEVELNSHKVAFEILVDELKKNNIIKSLKEIEGVGHRIVQGGDYFDKTVIADDEVVLKIDELATLAPLHNKAAITGINAAKEVIPDAIETVVFDTAFHQTIEPVNFLYAVPYEWYTDYKVRKYGAHGTSHKYIASRLNALLGRTNTKLITCHIGSGASVSAIRDGICIDTSMGLTPNAGLIMGTRSGDIDTSILTYMMEKKNISPKEMDTILNKKSGLLGISGVSNDSRDIEEGISKGNERCVLAQKMYVQKIIDYIAMYYFELGGVDAIAFSAGVGENSIRTRLDIMEGLQVLGVIPDIEANNCRGEEKLVTAADSKVPCYVIPTDEELMIARDTYNLCK